MAEDIKLLEKYVSKNKGLKNTEIATLILTDYPNSFKGLKHNTVAKRIGAYMKENKIVRDVEERLIPDIINKDRGHASLKDSIKETNQKYTYLLKENDKLSKLLNLSEQVNSKVVQNYKITATKIGGREATALALLSDLHAEERVDAYTVNNLNEYNPEICKQRVSNYFVNLLKLIKKERQDVKINRLVLALLGDNINGDIHEEYKQTNYLTPIEASLFVYEIFINGINYLLKDKGLEKIDVICKIGNHSRTTLKPYTNEEAKMSYEYGIYKHLAKHYENESRINFIIDDSYFTYIKIYDVMVRAHHGHNVKFGGGIGGLTVPLIKYIHRANEQIKADLDIIGHFHTRYSLPFVLVNGSVVGFDGYALKIGARPERAMQTLQLIDSMLGLTVNTPILV